MSVLTGPEIEKAIEEGEILVRPYVQSNVGSNSLDLRMGNEVKLYVDNEGRPLDVVYREGMRLLQAGFLGKICEENLIEYLRGKGAILDIRKENKIKVFEVPEEGIVLLPGRGYLPATIEYMGSDHYVPVLHGRSSVGRLFVSIHHTAGFGDTGFEGTWTLEVTVEHPITVYPGDRLCQVAFQTCKGEKRLYGDRKGSKYNGQKSPGESKFWKDFGSDS